MTSIKPRNHTELGAQNIIMSCSTSVESLLTIPKYQNTPKTEYARKMQQKNRNIIITLLAKILILNREQIT